MRDMANATGVSPDTVSQVPISPDMVVLETGPVCQAPSTSWDTCPTMPFCAHPSRCTQAHHGGGPGRLTRFAADSTDAGPRARSDARHDGRASAATDQDRRLAPIERHLTTSTIVATCACRCRAWRCSSRYQSTATSTRVDYLDERTLIAPRYPRSGIPGIRCLPTAQTSLWNAPPEGPRNSRPLPACP